MRGTIRPASAMDAADVADVLGAAFVDDVELRAFISGKDRQRRLRTYLEAEARLNLDKGGVIDLFRAADGTVGAAAVWEVPGRQETLWQTMRYAPAMLDGVRARGLLNWTKYRSEFMRLRPAVPHWHLVRLATDAQLRGQGIGTALLAKRLEIIDSTEGVAHLESSSPASARLYGRFGFETVGEFMLPFGARILAMTRFAQNKVTYRP